MTARRIVVVTYPYPPMPSVGGNRWLAMAKYLRRAGHEVTVVTTSLFGTHADDAAQGVVRTADLAGARLVRRILRRPPLRTAEGDVPTDTPPPALVTRVVVPDAYLVSWTPLAAVALRRLVREREVDCVVTTTPYESAHLAPLALGGRRPAWVADFRDGWSFESHRAPFPTRAQRALDLRLERLVVGRADRVVAATAPIAEDFRERLGVDAAHVPNGWDPELEPTDEPPDAPAVDPARATLVHTGTLSGAWGRDPRPLLEALQRVVSDHPELRERMELLLVGRMTEDQERLLRRYDPDGVARTTGLVSRAAAMTTQRRASALLLITAPDSRAEATGKLFEYLAAGRPIVALAANNEAARIVRETGTGVAVPPGDVDAIARELVRVVRGQLERVFAPRGLERYRYPTPAAAMAEAIEQAIAARI